MAYPRIEIKTDGEAPSIFTAIYVDGHKLNGVRRFELKQEVGNHLPILTVDLMALNLATDLRVLKMNHYGMGEIEDIVWKKEEEDEEKSDVITEQQEPEKKSCVETWQDYFE